MFLIVMDDILYTGQDPSSNLFLAIPHQVTFASFSEIVFTVNSSNCVLCWLSFVV